MDFTAYRHALHGISGVHATAYDSAGEIDAGLTAGLFEGIAAAGIHNIVSGGNTGEFYSLTTDEVMRLHAIAAEAIGGRAGFTAAVARSQREAIHGCARDRAWRVVEVEAGGAGATLALHLDEPALPWRFDLVQRVTLGAAGVVVALDLTNRGAAPMPFGIGLHPWFCKTGDARLEFAPARLHRRDARGLPLPETDPQPGFTPGAGQNLRDLPWLDGCVGAWSGRARLRIGGLDLILAATGALRHLQVYVPDDRPVFCAGPVSHLPDAINRPALGPQAAMTVLGPGASLSGTMWISAAPFDATAPEGDRP